MGKHPNAYLLANTIWDELIEANDDAISEAAQTQTKRPKKAIYKQTQKNKEGKMKYYNN